MFVNVLQMEKQHVIMSNQVLLGLWKRGTSWGEKGKWDIFHLSGKSLNIAETDEELLIDILKAC